MIRKLLIHRNKNICLCLICYIYYTVGYKVDGLLRSHKVIRNNNTYINFEKMKFKIIKINKTTINFDNLFGGDPVLGTLLFHI